MASSLTNALYQQTTSLAHESCKLLHTCDISPYLCNLTKRVLIKPNEKSIVEINASIWLGWLDNAIEWSKYIHLHGTYGTPGISRRILHVKSMRWEIYKVNQSGGVNNDFPNAFHYTDHQF